MMVRTYLHDGSSEGFYDSVVVVVVVDDEVRAAERSNTAVSGQRVRSVPISLHKRAHRRLMLGARSTPPRTELLQVGPWLEAESS